MFAAALLAAAAQAPAGEPVESIDLPQAIERALSKNLELARDARSLSAADLEVARAGAEFGLRVRPEASVDYGGGDVAPGAGLGFSRKTSWGAGLKMTGRLSEDSGGGGLQQGLLRLEVDQPVFRDFGSLVHKEPVVAAVRGTRRARRELELRKADLTLEVVRTYEELLRLEHELGSDEESFKRMDALVRLTEAKEGLGRTTRDDTLRAEFLKGQARFRLESDRERLSSLQRDFAELLGAPPETEFKLVPTAALELSTPTPDEAVKIALANRLEAAQALEDRDDAARGVLLAQRNLLPDLRLVARHDWTASGATVSRAMSLDRSAWFVGAAVQSDLNPSRERASLGQARVARASAEDAGRILELSIARQARQALRAHLRARAEAEIAGRNFAQSQTRARLARELFELGRGDSFSVADAEQAFLQAQSQLYSAQSEASVSAYRLSHALGTLTEAPEELKPKGTLR